MWTESPLTEKPLPIPSLSPGVVVIEVQVPLKGNGFTRIRGVYHLVSESGDPLG